MDDSCNIQLSIFAPGFHRLGWIKRSESVMECSLDEKFQKIKRCLHSSPYWQYLGLKIDHLEAGSSWLTLPASHNLINIRGNVHGGVLSSVVDMAASSAIRTVVPSEQRMATIELNINYLAPAEGALTVIGRVVHCGRLICVASVNILDSGEKAVASGMASYILFAKSEKPDNYLTVQNQL